MRQGAALCVEALQSLTARGLNTVTAVMQGQNALVEWEHYPGPRDVFDRRSGSQYFFHCHAAGERRGEHGHFHLFGRTQARRQEACTHLVGIGVDARGMPTHLFTTNRWVTDERWLPGEQVLAMVDRFSVGGRRPSVALNRWLGGMLMLFRPQIEDLVARRDAWLEQAARKRPAERVMEDRRTQVVSSTPVSFFDQVQAIYEVEQDE